MLGSSLRKLRILCFHGYSSRGSALSSQMQSVRSAFAPYAELFYMDAPALSSGSNGWWQAKPKVAASLEEENSYVGQNYEYRGWEKSREEIVRFFEEHGPFDGILGFSQGSTLSGVLVGLRSPTNATKSTPDRPLKFDFAIMIGGFPARDSDLAALYTRNQDAYDCPSLHVMGSSDGIVPIESSRNLAGLFSEDKRRILQHEGGHSIPGSAEALKAFESFLKERFDDANKL